MKASRRKAGKKAYKSGLTLEKKVECLSRSHQLDTPLEIELIRNHDAMSKARGKYGKLTAFTTGISSCDFSFWCGDSFGWIVGGMIEAKNRQGNRINKSALSCHQKDQLIRLEKLKQCGFVLVGLVETIKDELEEKQNYFLVPISHWFMGKKKSHNSEDLRAIGYELELTKVFNDNGQEEICPNILQCLKEIDEKGHYKEVPKEYKKLYDNKKIDERKSQYSTLDADFEDIMDDFNIDVDDVDVD